MRRLGPGPGVRKGSMASGIVIVCDVAGCCGGGGGGCGGILSGNCHRRRRLHHGRGLGDDAIGSTLSVWILIGFGMI